MKLAEILKAQGLNDEQITAVQNSMKENKLYTTSLENVDERYNKLKTQKTELEGQIKERDKQLSDLSKNHKDNEELAKQLEQLQLLNKKTKEDYENKIASIQFDYALEGALTSAKCKNNKALKALLNLDEVKYQDGKLEGLEAQLKALKQVPSSSCLFELEEKTPVGSGFNPGGTSYNRVTKEEFRKMNMLQRNELYRKDPQLYEELRK